MIADFKIYMSEVITKSCFHVKVGAGLGLRYSREQPCASADSVPVCWFRLGGGPVAYSLLRQVSVL